VILFLLGLVLGAAVATALTHVYAQNEVKSFSHDLALLQARLRTLARLAEAGLIKPDSVEAANALNEVHDMVMVAGARPLRESVNVVVEAGDDDDGPVPSVFR
jgi:cytochrome c-type biogenesis protein CcmH/NrfG